MDSKSITLPYLFQSISKIPRYFIDIYVRFVLQRIWQMDGCQLGKKIIWLGIPILVISPESTIEIGDGCLMCSRSSQTALGVNHSIILRTLRPGAKLIIGNGVRMSGTIICAAKYIRVGDRCVFGANVTIVDTDFHSLDPVIRSSADDANLSSHNSIEIGDDVFIGSGSTLLKGVHIGKGAIVGAASVVTKSIPEYSIFAGNPARLIGKVSENESLPRNIEIDLNDK